ncbi:aldose 1-epimerase, partial [Paraburkholderia sp.]|uniref:aldose 1-epimerase n=1 Tax=Paraburkholderia sp. TaxID=1926495 RepID=UPI002F3ED178
MTVANLVSASSPTSQSRRSRLAAAASPVLAGPSTSAVALGEGSAGDVACITLANAQLRVDVAPTLGGGVTRFDWRDDGALTPIFRRCRHVGPDTQPNQLACYPLLPYSNRIGGGQFSIAGRRVDVPRNRDDEPLPIHGDGWLAAWQLVEAGQQQVRLTLDRPDGKPYAFRAAQTYTLDGPTFVVALEIENTGRETLPFGLGVHPFFVRDADTELSAAAGGLWLSGDDWLPVRHVPAPPAWQFGVAYPLPETIVNHAFTGWSGQAA